jgi:fungal STAND N-terminal Goodbye domain
MSDQLASSRFEALFEEALHDYERQTGIPLAQHTLAEQFQNCQSVESVTTLLQEQTRAFSDFRGSDKIMKSLKSLVSALSRVSAIAAIGRDIGIVCPRLLIWCST